MLHSLLDSQSGLSRDRHELQLRVEVRQVKHNLLAEGGQIGRVLVKGLQEELIVLRHLLQLLGITAVTFVQENCVLEPIEAVLNGL